MRYLSNTRWDSLPIPKNDYRPRFFIELYQEILNANTPSSYQSRTMNLFSYAEEISNLIENYHNTAKNKSYISKSLEEFRNFIQTDNIAKLVFKKEIHILLTKFNICENLQDNQINELNLLIRIFLDIDKKQSYWQKMLNELIDSVCGDADLTRIKLNLDRINAITRLFVSYLLNSGFTNTFLFNRAEMLVQLNNYKFDNFKSQFTKILHELDVSNKRFMVHFLISSVEKIERKFTSPLQHYKTFFETHSKFHKNSSFIQFNEQVEKYHGEMKHFYIISFEITSANYANALIKAKERLLLILDLINVLLKVEVHKIALIGFQNQESEYIQFKHAIIDKHLDDKFFLKNNEVNLLYALKELNFDAVEKVKNSIRYFRLAKDSNSTEQKILNTWIALETLYIDSDYKFDSNKKNIIENIINYIPILYNSFSIIRKVRYVKGLLIDNKIILTKKIKETLNILDYKFTDNIPDEVMWKILKDDDLFESLMDSENIKELHHLKYRCTSVFNFVCNKANSSGNKSQTIIKNFLISKQSVENQLYRLYMMRNKIAHQGHYSNINPQLVNHLTDYLLISYAAIVIGATYLPKLPRIEKYSILDVLNMYKLQFEYVSTNLIEDNIAELNSVYVPSIV